PDPKQLAAWLVRARLDGPGWPDIQLADFADALGPTGLDEVARLVAERRAAGDPDSWADVGIKLLREQLAALSGDVDAHVAVLAENLHSARQYGEIVTVLRGAGRDVDAERWARRGLAEDPASHWTDGLREQLAGLLLASGRGQEAVRAAHPTPGLRPAAGHGRTRRPVGRTPGMGAGVPAQPGSGQGVLRSGTDQRAHSRGLTRR